MDEWTGIGVIMCWKWVVFDFWPEVVVVLNWGDDCSIWTVYEGFQWTKFLLSNCKNCFPVKRIWTCSSEVRSRFFDHMFFLTRAVFRSFVVSIFQECFHRETPAKASIFRPILTKVAECHSSSFVKTKQSFNQSFRSIFFPQLLPLPRSTLTFISIPDQRS